MLLLIVIINFVYIYCVCSFAGILQITVKQLFYIWYSNTVKEKSDFCLLFWKNFTFSSISKFMSIALFQRALWNIYVSSNSLHWLKNFTFSSISKFMSIALFQRALWNIYVSSNSLHWLKHKSMKMDSTWISKDILFRRENLFYNFFLLFSWMIMPLIIKLN